MNDDADILAGLHGLRETAPGFMDLAVALALGLVLAGLIGISLLKLLQRPRRGNMQSRVRQTRTLPEQERLLALSLLLREMTDAQTSGSESWTDRATAHFGLDPSLLASLGEHLYRPSCTIDPAPLEVAVLQAIQRTGR